MKCPPLVLAVVLFLLPFSAIAIGQGSFVNWETPHVHPIDLTPDGDTLLAVNLADNRLEVFDVGAGGGLTHVASVPVGLDPVSVRAHGNDEAWVVNHVSDSISIIDLMAAPRVVRTVDTEDEPCDVVFAGTVNERAFVSCSQVNAVQVFDPVNLGVAPISVILDGEDPRAMAVSADGATVYAAVFESGNGSTLLGGGSTMSGGFPPNVVNDSAGPYSGQNPPPNSGSEFVPAMGKGLDAPPGVGLIVKKNGAGQWMDDNGGDWTGLVSGPQAAKSGRPVGWDLYDYDLARIDADTLAVSYTKRLMNMNMAIGVHPTNGEVMVVGTDCTNEIRFEPNLNGRFLRVLAARVDGSAGSVQGIDDLNPHLDYTSPTLVQAERDKSIGDPRGVAWNPSGTRGYITGMGSNNVVVIDAAGQRVGLADAIEVGEGPTGIVYHQGSDRLFVLNKFEASISIVDATTELELTRAPFYDPTPDEITTGRKHLYDTHRNSGLGQIACASCHVDARMDRLAWDLGNPEGDMKPVAGQNLAANIPGLDGGFEDFHPMKGPMTTQTMQDIIGKEPHHWRGDRDGLEEFSAAFVGLQGDDESLTTTEMQEFEDFLATIHFPPNPFRNFDNTLPTNVPLPEHRSAGLHSPKGTPLPNGDAVRGHQIYRPPFLLDSGALACSTCHTLPTGLGTDSTFVPFTFIPLAPGPNQERHHALVSQDGNTNVSMKIPHLRNMHEKVGFDTTQVMNRAGFGFIHDGSVDTMTQFISEPVFSLANDQDLADMVAFMLAFAGSDLDYGGSILEPPATGSLDTHAGVGTQVTLRDSLNPDAGQIAAIDAMLAEADAGGVGVVVKGRQLGLDRGYMYAGGGSFQSDRLLEVVSATVLKNAAAAGSELTFTVVPLGTETRIGIDRDEDGFFDRDELDAGADPADPQSVPGCGSADPYGNGCLGSNGLVPQLDLTGCVQTNGAVTLEITQGPAGSSALLFLGAGQGAVPMGGGCTLNVQPLSPIVVGPLPLNGAGAFILPTTIPSTATAGTFTMQVICIDPGLALGFANSPGLEVTIP